MEKYRASASSMAFMMRMALRRCSRPAKARMMALRSSSRPSRNKPSAARKIKVCTRAGVSPPTVAASIGPAFFITVSAIASFPTLRATASRNHSNRSTKGMMRATTPSASFGASEASAVSGPSNALTRKDRPITKIIASSRPPKIGGKP
ncbi:hypothetical protein D9M72_547300 [compost metagenome]